MKTNFRKSTLLFVLVFSGIIGTLSGQSAFIPRKSIYFELAGSGGIGSINYEKQFAHHLTTEFTWRAGFSLAPIDKNNGTGLVFPLMINALLGKKAHRLEMGIGQGITLTTKGHFFALSTAVLGYRYQKSDKHWFYRVSYTPLISYLADFQYQHWAGFSVGYTFNRK